MTVRPKGKRSVRTNTRASLPPGAIRDYVPSQRNITNLREQHGDKFHIIQGANPVDIDELMIKIIPKKVHGKYKTSMRAQTRTLLRVARGKGN